MSAVLVYGGAGQLGDAIVTTFKENGYSTIYSVDFRQSNGATSNFLLTGKVETDVANLTEKLTSDNVKFDAVICAAGGWVGGDIKSKDILSTLDKLYHFNLESAVAASHVASLFLKEGGLLVLTGAAAATGPTPGMISYGMTKAATHHLISSLAESGLPNGATVAGILPICLDTATNRACMPDAKFADWTPLPEVAKLLLQWSSGNRPVSGALVKLVTKDGVTEFVTV